MIMNRFFTLLLAASCLTAVGQVTYPYNPDGNADGDIAVGDLQDFLVTYGNPFSPSEIMVGDSSLTYWVEQLSQTVQEQQEMIDSLSSTIGRMSLGDTEHFKFYELTWETELNRYRSILDFDSDGFVRLFGSYELEWMIVPVLWTRTKRWHSTISQIVSFLKSPRNIQFPLIRMKKSYSSEEALKSWNRALTVERWVFDSSVIIKFELSG